jgi:hypothetical protein
MNRFCAGLLLVLCILLPDWGQAQPKSGSKSDKDSKEKVEVFAGYSRGESDAFCCGNANGVQFAIGYKLHTFALLNGEFSLVNGANSARIINAHVGPQFRIPANVAVPFGRIMIGMTETRALCLTPESVRNFSVVLGGGLDLRLHRVFLLRIATIDRIWTEEGWDTRAAFGVVFRAP